MSTGNDALLRERGFAFFGAITASVSHEINNVLATINELSGLLDDIQQAAGCGAQPNPERMQRATQRIAGQVSRGETLVRRLNRFAHSPDQARAELDAGEALEAITTLYRRLATLRKVELECALPDQAPRLVGSRFGLQHAVFRCLEVVVDAAAEGDTVSVSLDALDDGVRIAVRGERPMAGSGREDRLAFLAVLVGEQGGTLQAVSEPDVPARLEVTFPGRSPARP